MAQPAGRLRAFAIVLDSLQQRTGAIANAGDGNPDLTHGVLRLRSPPADPGDFDKRENQVLQTGTPPMAPDARP